MPQQLFEDVDVAILPSIGIFLVVYFDTIFIYNKTKEGHMEQLQ